MLATISLNFIHTMQQALQQDADTEDGVMQEEVLARISAATCADYCRSADKRDGVIIGIAPICDGRCGRDCPGRFCTIGSRFWHDYGHPCWWGNKICCCGEL